MKQIEIKTHYLREKLLFSLLIVIVYIVGRSIPLYRIDLSQYIYQSLDAQELLMQTIGGDAYKTSVFAVGIAPYMIASILVQIASAIRNIGTKTRLSARHLNRITIRVALVLAVLQAFILVQGVIFIEDQEPLIIKQGIAVLELVAGVMIIIWLTTANKKYGVGGQTTIFLVNITDGIVRMLRGHSLDQMKIPLMIGLCGVVIALIFEGAQKQIPLQRISIHNVYSDKNYYAIKMNPIGVMPIMFSTALFTLPQMALFGLNRAFPNNQTLTEIEENLVLTRPLGIIVYIIIIYVLCIGFSFLMLNPREMAEQLHKSGDSIVDIHAGRDTKRYLSWSVFRISFFSATVMGIYVGIPLFLQVAGNVDRSLMMLPTSCMMIASMWYTIYQEIIAIRKFESYHSFL